MKRAHLIWGILTVGVLAAGPYLSAVQPLCPHPWW